MPITIGVDNILNWVGQDGDTAEATIEAQGFTVIRTDQYSQSVEDGLVISQTIESIPFGSRVRLTVSLGAIPFVTVRATEAGYFDGFRRFIGDTFQITTPQEYSPYWMTFVDPVPDEWIPLLETYSAEVDRLVLKQPPELSNVPEPFRSLLN